MAGPPRVAQVSQKEGARQWLGLVMAIHDPESLHPPATDGLGGAEVALGVQVQGMHGCGCCWSGCRSRSRQRGRSGSSRRSAAATSRGRGCTSGRWRRTSDRHRLEQIPTGERWTLGHGGVLLPVRSCRTAVRRSRTGGPRAPPTGDPQWVSRRTVRAASMTTTSAAEKLPLRIPRLLAAEFTPPPPFRAVSRGMGNVRGRDAGLESGDTCACR
jgi:hypothetical protein